VRNESSTPARKRWLPWLAAVVLGLVVVFILFANRVAALWSCHASGPSWSFPSRVYCDDVPLVAGRVLPAQYLIAQLEARGYRAVPEPALAAGTFSRRGDVFEIGLRGFSEAHDPRGASGPERVRVRVHDGWLVSVDRLGISPGAPAPGLAPRRGDSRLPSAAAPRLEPVLVGLLYDQDPTWRVWVALDRVPQAVRDAIVASEDRRFSSHVGVDVRGYLRALATNVRAGAVRQGGSTITQQLARSLFLGRQRTLGRKLAEVPLALGLETVLGKRRILEMYLNAVYWGQAGGLGIGGLGAAARWYFDAPVESLGVLEGATLAAIIPAPNLFDPFERPEVVLGRRNQVLRDLVTMRRLDAHRAEALALKPLNVRRGAAPVEIAPSYMGFVRDQLGATLPGVVTARQGLAVFTCMDLVWQRAAEAGLAQAVAALDGGGRGGPALEGAFVALEPGTGAVRALVGGRAPQAGAFNRTYQARRQTGSAIKPIVYAAAFASGRGFTPATVIPDVPRTFPTDRGPWTPRNDDGTYHTQVTLVKALERSLNVATTNLVDLVGPREVARVARRLGLGELKPVMSIGLGSNESTLLDLTRAFAVFGDGGRLLPCTAVRAVTERSGRIVERREQAPSGDPKVAGAGERAASPGRAIPEPVAALMTGLLTNVVRFGVAYPLRKTYGFTRPAAGKTGTTDDYRDAWFIGFTPDVVAGVWVGYDRPRSMGRLAVDTALPTWARIVGPLLQGFPPRSFANDAQLEWREVEPWTGFLAGPECRGQPVPFLPGTAPRAFCPPGTLLGPELESPDSLTGADSSAAGETPGPQNER
jgi:penicillin-binding protein 1B